MKVYCEEPFGLIFFTNFYLGPDVFNDLNPSKTLCTLSVFKDTLLLFFFLMITN